MGISQFGLTTNVSSLSNDELKKAFEQAATKKIQNDYEYLYRNKIYQKCKKNNPIYWKTACDDRTMNSLWSKYLHVDMDRSRINGNFVAIVHEIDKRQKKAIYEQELQLASTENGMFEIDENSTYREMGAKGPIGKHSLEAIIGSKKYYDGLANQYKENKQLSTKTDAQLIEMQSKIRQRYPDHAFQFTKSYYKPDAYLHNTRMTVKAGTQYCFDCLKLQAIDEELKNRNSK